MRIDPRHLAQLSMIVETGSFKGAADRLGLTQPALSRNIKTLEARIGAPVFDRSARRAVPTEIGLKLAQNGIAVRDAEEQASALSQLASSGAVGELRIGAPPIIAGQFLTSRISAFIQNRPDCKVTLRVGLVHELRSMLDRGQIDIVVGPRNLADIAAETQFLPLTDDRVGVLCRRGHPLTQSSALTAADFDGQLWVAHSRGSMLRQQTESALLALGIERLQIMVETDSIQSVLEIVGATNLISTMPIETSRSYLKDDLEFLDFSHELFSRPIGAISRKAGPENRILDAFLTELAAGVAHKSNGEVAP
ncbi:LysR family transcriptional regulator [uncultured Sulfitobacter sp.]|uniref:LysR family transcriptional regulator n=1 Tax=uncultured Sulfitobacter sp. TaxID=191468 RepID=UPI00260FFD46|nr:LysR family transcriptional regulator [uncultured Sulfitobacter sp.]